MGLDFGPNLIKMLDDGAIDGAPQISMLICDKARFVSDSIINVLHSAAKQQNGGLS